MPFSNPKQIKDHHALVNRERQSLFEQRRFYGWWPVVGKVKVKSKSRSNNKKKEKITKLTVSTAANKMVDHFCNALQSGGLTVLIKKVPKCHRLVAFC